MRARRRRPQLELELPGLGTVDPFALKVVEDPSGSAEFFVEHPVRAGPRVPLDLAGLNLAGAGQALLALSVRWMGRSRRALDPLDSLAGEVRMVVRRREARLMAALLRRHLRRLPQPPPWMPELLVSLEQIDEFLRWEDPGLSSAGEEPPP